MGKNLSVSQKFKQSLYKAFPVLSSHYHAYRRLIFNQESYLYKSGWMNSVALNKPVDVNSELLPWMNFSVIDLLRERVSDDMSVFEYGCGYSTLFLSKLCKKIVSVEHDQVWLETLKPKFANNAEAYYCEIDVDGDYCRFTPEHITQFDLVIVDGRDRVNCLIQSVKKLKENGVIILDDSHRKKYQEGKDYLLSRSFKALTISGLKPTGTGVDTSTIYYRDQNCFDL